MAEEERKDETGREEREKGREAAHSTSKHFLGL
jgi:hypothetical protein